MSVEDDFTGMFILPVQSQP